MGSSDDSGLSSGDDAEIEEEFRDRINGIIRGFNKPYNPANEPEPKLPAYHPSFKKVEASCGALFKPRSKFSKIPNMKTSIPKISAKNLSYAIN